MEAVSANGSVTSPAATTNTNGSRPSRQKLHGRAFYDSIGNPKFVLAPMVDASEFAWRMLTRSFMPESQRKDILAYSPMLHARLFSETAKYRDASLRPVRAGLAEVPPPTTEHIYPDSELFLDGNPKIDRPLFFQFCANDPEDLLRAARYVAPFCDAVDLNLGCPQGIARRGKYGAFLQEDPDLICKMINTLHVNLDVPVTAKIRCLETKEKTLEYARKVLEAGASILTLHGRQRHQKGHETGLADWSILRYLRENLPKETVLFSNGNILQHDDIAKCLEATGADAVMSAEGNLYDPSIFSEPPAVGQEGREYWRGLDGKGGYRMDAVFRRYMDIIYRVVLEVEPPQRLPLYMPGDEEPPTIEPPKEEETKQETGAPTKRKRGDKKEKCSNPNLIPMQAHLFNLLRPLVSKHTDIRDALAHCRAGDIAAFENVLQMVERVTRIALRDGDDGKVEPKPKKTRGHVQNQGVDGSSNANASTNGETVATPLTEDSHVADFLLPSSIETIERCRQPWWVCQPYVRPLPEEALAKGSLRPSKKELARKEKEEMEKSKQQAGEQTSLAGEQSTKRKRSASPTSERNVKEFAG